MGRRASPPGGTLRLRSGQARETPVAPLLRNYAAGDAVSCVTCGIGLLVVGLGVHHDGGSSVAVQRMAVAAERNVFILPPEICFAIGGNGKSCAIPNLVAFRIFQTLPP